MFITHDIQSIPEDIPPRVRPPIHFEKELASIHRYLKKNKDLMLKNQLDEEVRVCYSLHSTYVFKANCYEKIAERIGQFGIHQST